MRTANGPHLFQVALEEASGRNVLSMIEASLQEVNRRGLKKVDVLGLGEPRVYLTPLQEQGIACECILSSIGF